MKKLLFCAALATILLGTFYSSTAFSSALSISIRGLIPTEKEMAAALKEALQLGTKSAAFFLSKPGGYLDNARFKIPFPPDAIKVANKMRQMGMGKQVDEFILRMNRGAEDAAKEAAPIFGDAIQQMTLTDAKGILLGSENSATLYFQGKTNDALYTAFSPKIKTALNKSEATKYWTKLTTSYNKIPGVKRVETDLVKYTTNKALDGLFLKLSEEERDIRANFSTKGSSILKSVFGWAEKQVKR